MICSSVIKCSMVFKSLQHVPFPITKTEHSKITKTKDEHNKMYTKWTYGLIILLNKRIFHLCHILWVFIFSIKSLLDLVHSSSIFSSWLLTPINGPLSIHASFLLLIYQKMEWQKSPHKTFNLFLYLTLSKVLHIDGNEIILFNCLFTIFKAL